MKRRMFAWLLIVCLALTIMPVTARAETQTITVWVDGQYLSWAQERLQAFSALYPQYTFTAQACSLGETGTVVANDPTAAADVFTCTSGWAYNLYVENILRPFSDTAAQELTARNGEMVTATVATVDGKVYGAPYTSDTWFLYYNKNVFSEEDVKSLDTMLEKGVVSFPLANSWYFASFYFANGCTMFGPKGNDGDAGILFGGERGTQVTNYLVDLMNHPNFRSGVEGIGTVGMQKGTVDACFSGPWDYANLYAYLGDALGTAQPPTVNIGGSPKQMKAFCTSLAYLVNANSKHPEVAEAVALYLSNPESQKLMYQQYGVIPSAQSLVTDPAIQKDIATVAQMNTSANAVFPIPNDSGMQYYWNHASNFATEIINRQVTHDNAAVKTEEFNLFLSGNYEIGSGTCGPDTYWILGGDGTLCIDGSGPVTVSPWLEHNHAITRVLVMDEVTELPVGAFEYCLNIQEASLGTGLKTVPDGAFEGCTFLQDVTLPQGLTTIGAGAFLGCSRLSQITIPNTVTGMDCAAFAESGLTSLDIPDSVTTLGTDVLTACPRLKTITVGKGVETLSNTHVHACTALEAIHVSPRNPHYISQDGVVYSADGKTLLVYPTGRPDNTFRIPDFVEVIAEHAFCYFIQLETLVIPGSVRKVDYRGIDGVDEIKFLGDAPELDYAFNSYTSFVCYYPQGNATWDDVITKEFSEEILWIPYQALQVSETIAMHRLYNPNTGEHFYTGSLEERDVLTAAGWAYEGVAWNAPIHSGSPVHRLFNPNSGDHHYTMSEEERDMLVGYGWQYEGICWNSAGPGNLPLYRLYNPNAESGIHHYTGSIEERDTLVGYGWIYEGIGWFGMLN